MQIVLRRCMRIMGRLCLMMAVMEYALTWFVYRFKLEPRYTPNSDQSTVTSNNPDTPPTNTNRPNLLSLPIHTLPSPSSAGVSMNNPFGSSNTTSAQSLNHVNNPFDSDPNAARNRFPDLSATPGSAFQPPLPSQSPTSWQNQQHNLWSTSSSPYSFHHHQPSSFQSSATQPQLPQHRPTSPYGALPSPTTNFFSPFPNGSTNGFGGGVGPRGPTFTGMGVASGGPYTAVAPMLEVPTSYNGIGGDASGGYNGHSGMPGGLSISGNTTSPHALLPQFDPLSTTASNTPSTPFSSNGSITGAYPPNQGYYGGQAQKNPVGQSPLPGYGTSAPISSNHAPGMDPGHIYRAPGPQPNTISLTGFGGTHAIIARVRPHNYGHADHPRQIVQMHRAEMEQWDAYGWRQTLNSLESLRFTWESWRDDLGRGMSGVRTGGKDEAVMKAVSLKAVHQISRAGY